MTSRSAAFLSLALRCGRLAAQSVPALINYQGYLTTSSNTPIATADYELRISVFAEKSGGTAVWGPQVFDGGTGPGRGQKVPVVQGYFNVMLGPVDTASPPRPLTDAFTATNRYVEVTVGGIGTIAPRQQVLSAPFALFAEQARTAQSVAGGALTTTSDSKVGIGTTNPRTELEVAGTIAVRQPATTVGYVALNPGGSDAAGYIDWYRPGPTRIAYMGYKNAGVGNLNLALENSANFVVSGGKVGIRTSSPSDALQVNGNISSRAETATDGYIRLSPGGADYAGTVEFFKPGGPTRIAYLGYKSGGTANLGLNLEAGAHFVVGGGNVGIGTSAPSEKLEVAGTVKANRFVGDGSGLIGAAPPGSIMAYGGITAPPGWLLCNGATYLRTEYPQLFSAIGTAFGAPDDSRFRVPDTGGLFLRGRANGSTHDPDRDSRTASAAGGNVGDRVGSYQGSQFESHTHAAARNSGGKELASGGSGSRPSEGTTGAAGGSETRPKNLYVNYIIKY